MIVVVSTITFGASDAFGVRLRCAKTMWGCGRRDPSGQIAPTNQRYGKNPREATRTEGIHTAVWVVSDSSLLA